MSDRARPESDSVLAFRELEHLVRNLGEELATFRRRAHQAEARLKALGSGTGQSVDVAAEERVSALEAENARLRARLEQASTRTRAMLDRVRFLRQQHVLGGEP